MQRRHGRKITNCTAGLLLAFAVFSMLACASGTTSSTATDEAEGPNAANPMRWVTYSRQPMADRRAAVERMLAEHADAFWVHCAAKTLQIDDWPMIRLLAEKAWETRDERALPWLIRSWAMPSVTVEDTHRPERRAIEWIAQESARQTLSAIVFESDAPHDAQTEIAAWSVLVRIVPDSRLRVLLNDASYAGASTLVSMLKRFEPVLDVLPADRVGIGQLLFVSVAHHDAQVAAWARYRASQAGKGTPRIALRHLSAITHRDATRDAWTWQQWLEHVKARLIGQTHVSRGEGATGDAVVSRRPDRLIDHAELLGISDLLVLDHLLDVMNDPRFIRVAFEQAEADRIDTSTEFGGALAWNDRGDLGYRPFDPLVRRHDQAYIASTPCMQAVYLGLAHVHFHTQRYDNAAWAGPGKGDLDFADRQHVNCVVLTYVDEHTLNVDAYFPGRIVIDLGCITR